MKAFAGAKGSRRRRGRRKHPRGRQEREEGGEGPEQDPFIVQDLDADSVNLLSDVPTEPGPGRRRSPGHAEPCRRPARGSTRRTPSARSPRTMALVCPRGAWIPDGGRELRASILLDEGVAFLAEGKDGLDRELGEIEGVDIPVSSQSTRGCTAGGDVGSRKGIPPPHLLPERSMRRRSSSSVRARKMGSSLSPPPRGRFHAGRRCRDRQADLRDRRRQTRTPRPMLRRGERERFPPEPVDGLQGSLHGVAPRHWCRSRSPEFDREPTGRGIPRDIETTGGKDLFVFMQPGQQFRYDVRRRALDPERRMGWRLKILRHQDGQLRCPSPRSAEARFRPGPRSPR